MSLKPGMQVDSTQVKIIGTIHNIDDKYIKETPTLGNLKTYLLLKLNAIVQPASLDGKWGSQLL